MNMTLYSLYNEHNDIHVATIHFFSDVNIFSVFGVLVSRCEYKLICSIWIDSGFLNMKTHAFHQFWLILSHIFPILPLPHSHYLLLLELLLVICWISSFWNFYIYDLIFLYYMLGNFSNSFSSIFLSLILSNWQLNSLIFELKLLYFSFLEIILNLFSSIPSSLHFYCFLNIFNHYKLTAL